MVFGDRIRAWLGGSGSDFDSAIAVEDSATLRPRADKSRLDTEPVDRPSRGLNQMFELLPERRGLSILDLGEINQANVGFITGLGHRHYSEDLLRSVDNVFGHEDPVGEQSDPSKAREFLEGALRFPNQQFDVALVWDTLQFLTPELLEPTLERLLNVVRPGGALLAHFHAEVRQPTVTVHSFRILDEQTLRLAPKAVRPPAQTFNNRTLEKLFGDCKSVKFFLTRDSLKEVLVRR